MKILILPTFVMFISATCVAAESPSDLDLSAENTSHMALAANDRQRGAKKVTKVDPKTVPVKKPKRVTGKNARKQKLKTDMDAVKSSRAYAAETNKSGKMKHAMHDGAKGRRAKKKEHIADAYQPTAEKLN